MLILKALKFIIVSILSIVYLPLNSLYLYTQKHYLKWKKEDIVSYIIATPLYYLLFIITLIISTPLEIMGESLHPPLENFK